jgi:hypothetical protein
MAFWITHFTITETADPADFERSLKNSLVHEMEQPPVRIGHLDWYRLLRREGRTYMLEFRGFVSLPMGLPRGMAAPIEAAGAEELAADLYEEVATSEPEVST